MVHIEPVMKNLSGSIAEGGTRPLLAGIRTWALTFLLAVTRSEGVHQVGASNAPIEPSSTNQVSAKRQQKRRTAYFFPQTQHYQDVKGYYQMLGDFQGNIMLTPVVDQSRQRRNNSKPTHGYGGCHGYKKFPQLLYRFPFGSVHSSPAMRLQERPNGSRRLENPGLETADDVPTLGLSPGALGLAQG